MTGEERACRLLADAMLGRLARWLRALGFDTAYDAALADRELLRLARAEGRMLLTRDRQLSARRGVRALLVTSDRVDEQLGQVLSRLPSRRGGAFGRCLLCNHPLIEVDRGSVEARVPEWVWETQVGFRYCGRCGRVFWRGTHWARMVARLRELGLGDYLDQENSSA